MEGVKKGWLCRLGMHRRIWQDCSMFNCAPVCGVCQEYTDKSKAAALLWEREQWSKAYETHDRLERKWGNRD